MAKQLKVGLFRSAGSVHLMAAADEDRFARAGLDVSIDWVTSSDQQLGRWDSGEYDVMHSSPDHLLRPGRRRDPVIVLGGGIGELAVYMRAGTEVGEARWGVDAAESAFALVLRAIVEDVGGHAVAPEDLIPVGGTQQRLQALLDGQVDGATLSPPFSQMAERNGLRRLGGHLDVVPEYLSTVVVVSRSAIGSAWVDEYREALEDSARDLSAGGRERIADVLERNGWSREVAEDAAEGVLGPAGVEGIKVPSLDNLQAVIALRKRFYPDWQLPGPPEALLAG